jgi:preprotein translocase subunit SecA
MPDEESVQVPAAQSADGADEGEEQSPIDFSHVGRNDPCPCGSGKRFKDCHGKLS